ncbi:MAG: hypothetical protein GY810_07415 [Aureispira sp.]|nr:hypothetical protein [Aureispira sp.]
MPDATGLTISQDQEGFIWLGTQQGISRYDGYSFKTYQHNPNNPNSLSNNYVNYVFSDKDGYIWVSTRNGLNRFDPKAEVFERYIPDSTTMIGPNNFGQVHQNHTGDLYILQAGKLLKLVNWEERKFAKMVDSKENFDHLIIDQEDNLWLSSRTLGIKLNNTQEQVVYNMNLGPQNLFNAFFIDRQHQIWLGSKDGLSKYNQRLDSFVLQKQLLLPFAKNSNQYAVTQVLHDKKGTYWIGTRRGLWRLIPSTDGTWQHLFYEHSSSNPESLADNNVICMYEDLAGLIWIGTSTGIHFFDPLQDQVKSVNAQSNNSFKLTDNSTLGLCEDNLGQLWVGLYDGGLDKVSFNGQFPKFSDHPNWLKKVLEQQNLNINSPASKRLASNRILQVKSDKYNQIWIGTKTGLQLYDQEKDQVYSFPRPNTDIPHVIYALHIDQQQDSILWIGGTNGLSAFDTYHRKYIPNQQFPTDLLTITEDSKGNFWLGGAQGLHCMDKNGQTLETYQHSPSDSNTISHNVLMDIHIDQAENIWVGTLGGGLNCLNPLAKKFTHYTKAEGLSSDIVFGILEDNHGHIWMSTNEGVSKLNIKTQQINCFYKEDGFNYTDFTQLSFLKSSRGEFFLGTPKGLNIFHPDSLQYNQFIPKVYLTAININYKEAIPSNSSILSQTAPYIQQLTLTPTEKHISFEFSALNFRNSHKNQYKFRLKGYDEKWVYRTSKERYATYTNLPSGNYTFEVKASNDNNIWNEQGLSIAIIVLPPFYKTWWFISLMIMMGIGTVSSLIYWYNRRKYLKQIQALELQQKVQAERERISRDLHDNVGAQLTNIATNLDIVGYQIPKKDDEYIQNRIDKVSDNTRHTIQLLRDTIWAINKNSFTIEEFAQKVRRYLQKYLEGYNLEWEIKTLGKSSSTLSPTQVLNIFRITQEAVQNTIKYANAQQLIIQFNTQQKLTLTIEDNGIGIDNLGTEIPEGHYGLQNMAHRAKEIGAQFSISSTKGLCIQLVVPITKNPL